MGRERRTYRIIGARAEKLALRYLLARGLVLLSRNFHYRGGEIDLVMLDDNCIAFVEVRFRASSGFVAPHLTVDRHKQQRILATAARFLARNPRLSARTTRFDVVAVSGTAAPEIRWLRDAFRPEDSSL